MEHYANIDSFKNLAVKVGHECVVKTTDEVSRDDMNEVDCVVALGGDNTFLQASALIWDRRVPILGINISRQEENMGVLSPHFIDYKKRDKHAAMLIETMNDDHSVGYDKRSRILYEKVKTNENEED